MGRIYFLSTAILNTPFLWLIILFWFSIPAPCNLFLLGLNDAFYGIPLPQFFLNKCSLFCFVWRKVRIFCTKISELSVLFFPKSWLRCIGFCRKSHSLHHRLISYTKILILKPIIFHAFPKLGSRSVNDDP